MTAQLFQFLERYVLGPPIASGGMATVHLGRPISLPRVVAIKRLQADLARDPTFVRMFLDEVQLLSRIRHKNVVAPIEHFQHQGQFFMVMEYVEGLSLAQLFRAAKGPIDARLVSKIMSDVLIGLDAAHEAIDCSGQPLNLVHRDVSPHNILVGTDGATRIVDFGIAKAAWRAHVTHHGQLKGKPGYIAPEQLALASVDRRTDVYGAGIVLFELLTGTRLFPDQKVRYTAIVPNERTMAAPSRFVPHLPRGLDDLVLSAVSVDPGRRFPDARTMADALMDAAPPARDFEVGAWVATLGRDELERRGEWIAELENARLTAASVGPSRLQVGSVAASSSGYAIGKSELYRTRALETLPLRWRRVSGGRVVSLIVSVTLGLLALSYAARSRGPAPSSPAEEAPSRANVEPVPSQEEAVVHPSEVHSAVQSPAALADVAAHIPPSTPAHTRPRQARGPLSSSTAPAAPASPLPMGRARDVRAPSYDPPFDDRRR